MFKRIFWFLLGGIAMLAGIFFLCGKLANPKYTGTQTVLVEAPVDKVWHTLEDTEAFSESPREVNAAELTGTNAAGYATWKEHSRLAGTLSLEITEKVPNERMVIRLLKSGFGMTGTWTFALAPEGENTRVTLTENSMTEGLFMRSLLNTVGRDANMGLLLDALKKKSEML